MIHRAFPSLVDWVNYAENQSPNDGPDNTRESITNGKSFTGVNSKAEAFDLLRAGWPTGLAKMREVMDCVRNLIRIESPQYEFHDALEGAAPNIENYLMGIPEDMHAMHEVEQDAPPTYLDVQCDLTVNCMTTPEQCTWGGAVVFAAMEALKAQGCHVNLTLTHSVKKHGGFWSETTYDNDEYIVSVPIPSNLDMDTLAFLFTHPAAFRVCVFSIEEHEPKQIRDHFGFYRGGGYGIPRMVRLPNVQGSLAISTIVHQFGYHHDTNVKAAQSMLQTLVDTKFHSYTKEV